MTPLERPVYDLLPAVHRNRDAELGHPLRSLLEVVEDELRRLREDIDGLYDNWFAETCAEWVLPYLADLLGVEGLTTDPDAAVSRRALVAGTVAHRRRKGTTGALEQVSRAVTGWPTRAVEYFTLLGTTQNVNHPRPGNVRTPDLRSTAQLARLGTAFDTVAHTVDVRHADRGRGRHNIGVLGLHLWSLAACPCTALDARALDAAAGRWTFDPAGRDVPLFTRPRATGAPGEEAEAPAPLRRLRLHQELAAVRAGTDAGTLFGADPVLAVTLADGPPAAHRPVAPAQLVCADLTGWERPPAPADDPAVVQVAVDPVLGRLTLPPGVAPKRVRVDFSYGCPGDLGAGPHDRRATLATALAAAGTPWPDTVDWHIGVSRDLAGSAGTSTGSGGGDGNGAGPSRVVATLGEAIAAWQARPDRGPGRVGVIAVLDSATYHEALTGDRRIVIPPGNRLLVLAATGRPEAPTAAGSRPHLVGDIEVVASGDPAAEPAQLAVEGLSVEGRIAVLPGQLDSLVVSDCTLTTDRAASLPDGGLVAAEANPRLAVRLLRTVCAGVRLHDVPRLDLTASIVHSGGAVDPLAVDAGSADTQIESSTVLGATTVRTLTADDTILHGRAEAVWRQQGYLRFSYAPLGSRLPRRYRCQPADEQAAERVAPVFTSLSPADPGFGRLAEGCPPQIASGGEKGTEMGAFRFLQRPRRLADLAAQLDGYLRFGLEAGVFLAD